ncbi:unnamed protein product, partial [Oikopleura dioica]
SNKRQNGLFASES